MSTISEQICDDVHLHSEIEVLKNALADKHSQLMAMENACLQESDRQVELEDSIIAWQDKYERLYESHKRVQKVNQNLEDKLLKLVDRNSGERAQLTSDVATLSVRLAQANYTIQSLQREIERYKTDMSVAIQLLQCKPDSFVSPKISSLPLEIQTKVSRYMRLDTTSHSDSEGSVSGVGMATANSYHVLPASESPPPVCPFPPTAMVYSMRGLDGSQQDIKQVQSSQDPLTSPVIRIGSALGAATNRRNNLDIVSPSLMAKFLEDELKSSDVILQTSVKHCDTCQCGKSPSVLLTDLLGESQKYFNVGTQTVLKGDSNNSLCLRCNSNLNSPSNSPYIMKLIKSSDSVKSSVSDFLQLQTPDKAVPTGLVSSSNGIINSSSSSIGLAGVGKKDDLQVNPILGHHHRFSDRVLGTPESIPRPSKLSLINSMKLSDTSLQKLVVKPIQPPSSTVTTPSTLSKTINANGIGNLGSDSPSYVIKDTDKVSNKPLLHSDVGGIGSTNSLWSKTSSSKEDGAKMFENFNRNLIKTIKAENPKMVGPRICSLRIQNGTNNILLDNLSDDMSETKYGPTNDHVTPVLYTRRNKFLDEELLLDDDPSIGLNGAIKTTVHTIPTTTISQVGNNATPANSNIGTQKISMVMSDNENVVASSQQAKDICVPMSTTTSPHSSDRICNLNEPPVINPTAIVRLDINKLDGIELNSKKSCTQSSSISSEIDLQESALLRRQQLSRVAEWVQNNSKLINTATTGTGNNNGNNESDNSENENLVMLSQNDNINNNSNANNISTSHSDQQNKIPKMQISHLVVASDKKINLNDTQSPMEHSSNCAEHSSNCAENSSDLRKIAKAFNSFAQTNARNLNNFNANLLLTNMTDDYVDEEENDEEICDYDDDEGDENNVDFAQMEYNVKQFLLKQNEWSSSSRRLSVSSSYQATDACNNNNNINTNNTNNTNNNNNNTNNISNSITNTSNINAKYAINPHRTETNL